jgi:hypothetical protein
MGTGRVIGTTVAACLLAVATHAAEVDLSLDPGLKIRDEQEPGKKEKALIATLPLIGDAGEGCVLELDLTIVGIWYYAPLRLGIQSADGDAVVGLHFEKANSNSDCECRLYVRTGKTEKIVAKWETVDCAKYRLVFKWGKDGKGEFMVKRDMADVFRASFEASSPFTADELFLHVMNGNENGYIGYDCEDECIFMRSQPGDGSYTASASIDYISTKAPKQGGPK